MHGFGNFRLGRTLLATAACLAPILVGASPVLANMSPAYVDNLDKRAFALGEINGYLTMCGAASALHHRDIITKEAKDAGASGDQLQAVVYAFDKGLSAGATAAPLQFKGCTKDFYAFLEQKNEALGALQKQSRDILHNK